MNDFLVEKFLNDENEFIKNFAKLSQKHPELISFTEGACGKREIREVQNFDCQVGQIIEQIKEYNWNFNKILDDNKNQDGKNLANFFYNAIFHGIDMYLINFLSDDEMQKVQSFADQIVEFCQKNQEQDLVTGLQYCSIEESSKSNAKEI